MSDISKFNFLFSNSQTVLYNNKVSEGANLLFLFLFYWTVIFYFQILPYRNTPLVDFILVVRGG